jgi:hypothetical protein
MAAILAAGGVAILPVGYLLGAVSIWFMRQLWKFRGFPGTFEASFEESDYNAMRKFVASVVRIDKNLKKFYFSEDASSKNTDDNMLYVAATFDHEILPPGVSEWIARRWNSFHMSVNSIGAIIIGHLVAFILNSKIPADCMFFWTIALPSCLLTWLFYDSAHIAWKETNDMFKFQINRLSRFREIGFTL